MTAIEAEMKDMSTNRDIENGSSTLSRRGALAAAGACFAMLNDKALAAMDAPAGDGARTKPVFAKDSDATGVIEITGIHQGKGTGKSKVFRFGAASAPSAPSYMLIYDLPPGASEGVHTHFLDNRNQEGSFDEYYYILGGQGQMEIDGEIVPVVKGDHVHTPLEVAHGIENTHATENLRVFLTYIRRGNEPPRVRSMAPKPAAT